MSLPTGQRHGSHLFSQFKEIKGRRPEPNTEVIAKINAIQSNVHPVGANPITILEEQERQNAANQFQNIRIRERMLKEALRSLPVAAITAINFSIMNEEILEKLSVAEITSASKEPIAGSLYDPRMGALDKSICQTCELNHIYCRGHVGHIKLNVPIYHPNMMNIVLQVLSVVCHSCSRLLADREWLIRNKILEMQGTSRLKAMADLLLGRVCPYKQRDGRPCQFNPIEYVAKNSQIYGIVRAKVGTTASNAEEVTIPIENVRTIINNISIDDAHLMGFRGTAHPKHLIRTKWPVSSPCARTPVITSTSINYDRLDDQYEKIIRINNQILNLLNNPAKSSQEKLDSERINLYTTIGELATGTEKAAKDSNNVFKSLSVQLDSKKGLFRKNILSGKMPLSVRLVITNDPNMRLGELRVPEFSRRILTIEEEITPKNKHLVDEWIRENIIELIKPGSGPNIGQTMDFRDAQRKPTLKIGDTVIRQAVDGDYVTFVRQPVLLKVGFMGYRIRICRDPRVLTFGMHLSATTPHHADFDGDEMTAFSIMSDQVKFLAGATENLISSITGRPVYEVVYNALTSLYLLTKENQIFSSTTFLNLLTGTSVYYDNPIIFPPNSPGVDPKQNLNRRLDHKDPDVRRWLADNSLLARAYKFGLPLTSNKVLFSAILPAELNYSYKGVLIRKGILLQGQLTKAHLGTGSDAILQKITDLFMQSGLLEQQRAVRFLDDAYILGDNYLEWRGLSFGLSSTIAKTADPEYRVSKEIIEQTTAAMNDYQQETRRLVRANPDREVQITLEREINWYAEILKNPERALVPSILRQFKTLTDDIKRNLITRNRDRFITNYRILLELQVLFPEDLRNLIQAGLRINWPENVNDEQSWLLLLDKIQMQFVELGKDIGLDKMRKYEINLMETQLEQLGELTTDNLANEIREQKQIAIVQSLDGAVQKLFTDKQLVMETDEAEAMIASGSKGKIASLGQMSFIGNQQFLDGKLHSANANIPGRNYNMPRSDPWSPLGKDIMETRRLNDYYKFSGFAETPFVAGLRLRESAATGAPARQAGINTNLDVSKTGYQTRKIATAVDCTIFPDYTVRTITTESTVASVVSWSYGDNFRVEKTIEVEIDGQIRKTIIDLQSWSQAYNWQRGWVGRNAILVWRNAQNIDIGVLLRQQNTYKYEQISGDDADIAIYSVYAAGIHFVIWSLPVMEQAQYERILEQLPYVTRAYSFAEQATTNSNIDEMRLVPPINFDDELQLLIEEIKSDPQQWQNKLELSIQTERDVQWIERPAALRGYNADLANASTSILTPREVN